MKLDLGEIGVGIEVEYPMQLARCHVLMIMKYFVELGLYPSQTKL